MSAAQQLELSVAVVAPLIPGDPRERRFWAWLRENEHVYERMRRLAFEAQASGAKVGIRLLWERLRWDLTLEARHAADEPKLNNLWTPFLARLLMRREKQLAGYFDTRDSERAEQFDARAARAGE